MIKTT